MIVGYLEYRSLNGRTVVREKHMADGMDAGLDQFRAETRDWLEENCPQSMRTPQVEDETV